MKLVLGCYDAAPHEYHHQFLEGGLDTWTLTDINPRHENLVKMDARKIPYKDVEAIYASHILEHVRYNQVLNTLRHWYEVLKTDGWVHINVPNMHWFLDAWVKINCGEETGSSYFDTKEKLLDIIDGDASTDFDTHKSWFNEEKLEKYLRIAGFKNIKVWSEFEAHDMVCVLGRAEK